MEQHVNVLRQMTVVSSCQACEPTSDTCLFPAACSRQACVAWQQWAVDPPLPLSHNATMLWRLTNLVPIGSRKLVTSPVVGVSPAARNQGGRSSLPLNSRLARPMAQYTFRTLMATANPSGPLNPQPTPGTSGDGSRHRGGDRLLPGTREWGGE